MNKKIFNIGLYIDAIKQLRIIGITATIILVIEAIIIPIGYYFSYNTNIKVNSGFQPPIVNFFDVNFLLILCFIVIAPLLTLYLFSFLNKRNSSDFFHSIPHSRPSLFLSYFSAIITWIIIILVVNSTISLICAVLMKNYYTLNMSSVAINLFNIFAGSFFVAACIAIAMCITGTIFNNVIVSCMIIFVPRIIITVMLSSISTLLPIISYNNFIPILDTKYNVVFGFVFSALIRNDYMEPLISFSSGLYTLIASVIFTFIAMLLFRFRKSESAGFSAPNRFLQAAYRIIIALIICLFPIYLIFDNIVNGTINAQSLFEYAIFYIIAVIAFFVYELITTRKWKNLIKAIPSLLILVILNAGIIGCMFGIYRNVLNFTPASDEIKSIQIISTENNSTFTYTYNYNDTLMYFTKASEETKIDNEVIKQIISDSLKSSVELLKDSIDSFRTEIYSSTYKTIAIHTDKGTYYRNIIISKEDIESIAQELTEVKEYKNAYLDLPEISNITTVSLSNSALTDESVSLIYNTFREEVSEMSFRDFYSYLNTIQDYGLDTLTLTSSIEMESYSASIPITSYFPKTCKVYFEELNKYVPEYKKELLKLFEMDANTQFSIDFIPYEDGNENKNSVYSLYCYSNEDNNLDTMDEDIQTKLIDLILNSPDAVPSAESELLEISAWYYNESDYTSESFFFFIPVETSEDIEFLNTLNTSLYN